MTLFSILFHHQTTTEIVAAKDNGELFSILFHHQTTTAGSKGDEPFRLFSILFHHQTTTAISAVALRVGCLVSYFITKPQPKGMA